MKIRRAVFPFYKLIFIYLSISHKTKTMKRPYLFAIVIAIASCGGAEEDESTDTSEEIAEMTEAEPDEGEVLVAENTTELGPGIVGPFEIGALIPKLSEDLNSRIANHEVLEEGELKDVVVTVVYNSFEDIVDLQMEDSDVEHHEDLHIMEILVHSNYYQTEMGVGVGTTIEDFAAAYPDYTIWYTHASERYVIETSTLVGVQFLLDSHDCINTPLGESDQENLELSDFEAGSKIAAIRVY
jgi:hypothetical protein